MKDQETKIKDAARAHANARFKAGSKRRLVAFEFYIMGGAHWHRIGRREGKIEALEALRDALGDNFPPELLVILKDASGELNRDVRELRCEH